MPVYFFNRDPNNLFPTASSYSKNDVDSLFSGLTTDGVTQSAMTYAIEDFISATEINQIMSDLVVNYIPQTTINTKFDDATINFWTSDEIDSALSSDTSYFYNPEELDIYASGRTATYPKSQEVYDNSYTTAEVSQLYWHPEPYYKRILGTNATEYTLGGVIGNTTEIHVSGNTYWEVIQSGVETPSSWYSLSQSTGEGSLFITVTSEETNTGSDRSVDLEFSAVQINQVPFTVSLTQITSGGAE